MAASLDDWANLYDSVYSYVRQDIPFYVQEALNSGGPVLELGCGTGRVSSAIAKTGVDLVGIDSSSKMLEVAQHKMNALPKASGAISLVEADMRDFSLDQRFPLIIIPFRGFLSLLTVGDQTKTLLNIKRHLTPNGRLVFNVFVPDLDMLAQDSDVQYHLRDVTNPDTGTRFVLWHLSDYDHHNQVGVVRSLLGASANHSSKSLAQTPSRGRSASTQCRPRPEPRRTADRYDPPRARPAPGLSRRREGESASARRPNRSRPRRWTRRARR